MRGAFHRCHIRPGHLGEPLALGAEDYLELLPTRWQAVNSYGIKVNHRIYDCDELNGLHRVKSGIAERKNRWEIRHDPHDIRLLWLRDHHEDRWITVPWRLLSTTATPFGELASLAPEALVQSAWGLARGSRGPVSVPGRWRVGPLFAVRRVVNAG